MVNQLVIRCKVERGFTTYQEGGSDVDFRECANERDRMKGVTDPYHHETVRKFHDVGWYPLKLDAVVEVTDGFPEPQANDQERGDT